MSSRYNYYKMNGKVVRSKEVWELPLATEEEKAEYLRKLRNEQARAIRQVYEDCGLVRCVVNGKVFYE